MIIQIKMDIKHNNAIIKYYKSYIAVIHYIDPYIFCKAVDILNHFLPQVYSIMYPELIGSANVRNNGSDHPSAIIEYAHSFTQAGFLFCCKYSKT